LKSHQKQKIAVLIPCFNEEGTVGKVVRDFKGAVGEAEIFVFDNDSTDKTAEIARQAGAVVVRSYHQGKGNVVRHMFDKVEADIYIMVDGDDTYPADEAPGLIEALNSSGAAMVVGSRMKEFDKRSFRRFHLLGNRLVTKLISVLFKVKVTDVLSGYRVFSREFVKTVPLVSKGFEVETEMTLQAAAKDFQIMEVPIKYSPRPEASNSKLNTYSDGFLIIKSIMMIFKDYKPFVFFSGCSIILAVASLFFGYAPIHDFYTTGEVIHMPRAVLAASVGILATLSFAIGLILDTISKYHDENFVLWRRYLKKRG